VWQAFLVDPKSGLLLKNESSRQWRRFKRRRGELG
jgi:hypothetical protein